MNAAAGSTKVTNCRERSEVGLWLEVILTYSNVFILHIPNALQHSTANCIAKIFGRSLWMNVTQIHCPVHALNALNAAHTISIHHFHWVKSSGIWREWREGGLRRHARLCDKRLCSGSLSLLGSCLLRFRNVGTAIFAIVYPFTGPRWLSWQSVHNLFEKR